MHGKLTKKCLFFPVALISIHPLLHLQFLYVLHKESNGCEWCCYTVAPEFYIPAITVRNEVKIKENVKWRKLIAV
jgi:hypothetical protein